MNKIFLIDDDEDDILFFKDAIAKINPLLQCDSATNGKIALDKLKSTSSLPELIFLDLNMPIMNGFDFLVHFKNDNRLSNVPIGIFTTSNILKDKIETKKLGARFFLTKPSDFQVLCKMLEKILSSDFSNENNFVNTGTEAEFSDNVIRYE